MTNTITLILIICLPAICIAAAANMILVSILSSHLYSQLEDVSNMLAKILRMAEEAAEEERLEEWQK